MPLYLSFLMRFLRSAGSGEALGMAEHTLHTMRGGGIYDQIGFGFHRYSVDREWLIPHFEKMLYDQALLMAYLEAFQITRDTSFMDVAREIFAYVEREMTAPGGGFYTALDADSQGSEGSYYLWTTAEVESVIGQEASRRFCALMGITKQGNFEGRNILFLPIALNEFAVREGIPVEKLRTDLESWRRMLLQAREKRVRPLRDEKVLTAWNGLMIAALARGYAVTGDDTYRVAAGRAASFIRENMVTTAGRLLRIMSILEIVKILYGALKL